MGRLFSVSYPVTGIAKTTATNFFELAPAADKSIRLHSIFIAENTDLSDAQEEVMILSINRRLDAATTGTGTGATPQPIDYVGTTQASAGCTAKVGITTNGGGGTITPVWVEGFNIRAGYERIFPPEMRFQFNRPTGGASPIGMTVNLEVAPTDSITFFGVLVFEEEN